jgi:leucyl-tRNA synthetase
MGADKLVESTQNAPEFICPNCLPKSKNFDEKRLHWASVVRVTGYEKAITHLVYFDGSN